MSLKKYLKKSIAAFMALSLISGNCYLCGIGLSEVIAQDIKQPDLELNLENSQYIQYKEDEYSGVAVQAKFQIGIEQEETHMPIKGTEISLNLPVLNGYLPEKANVVDSDTLLSTGEENNSKINQNYDSNSGLLNVSYENEEAYSNYTDETKDEFEIIYIYPAEAYTGNEEEIVLEYELSAKMNFVTEEYTASTQRTQTFKLKEKDNKGNLVTFGVTELKDKIYKGFMYSNVENGTNYDTEFKTVSSFCVLDSKTNKEIELEIQESNFITNKENEISSNGQIKYASTKINKDEFDKILGEEGYIEFYTNETIATIRYIEEDEDSKRIAVIYSDGKVNVLNDEDKNLLIEYPENITNFKVKMSAPITEGYIHFENQNIIEASKEYVDKVENLAGIRIHTLADNYESSKDLLIVEPETKVTVTSSNLNFSTLQKSSTTLTINLDSTNASTKLFDNPVITVKLPEGLTDGNLSSPEIVNGNGLAIENATANDNIITIELDGKQTSYDTTNVSGGASIVMDIENIDLEDVMPTHEDKIEVTCVQGEEQVQASQVVNIVSKSGVLLLSKLSNFDNNQVLTAINGDVKTVEIAGNEEAKEAVHTLNLINNCDENLTSVVIVGRIGYSNDEITSTFDTELTKPIEVANGKVYYSTNKDASYTDESWTEEFTKEAKAYKIVINNGELQKASCIGIKLYVKIPANIGVNQETYLNWDATYQYQGRSLQEETTIGMKTPRDELSNNINKIDENITTPEGDKIPVRLSITPSITQNYVHSTQRVTYKIKVTNNGEEDLNNVVVRDIIPENAIYTYYEEIEAAMGSYMKLTQDTNTKQKEWEIASLKSGETAELEIMLTMASATEEQEVINSVSLVCNEQTISSESKLNLKPAKISTSLTTSSEQIKNPIYKAGYNVSYYIKVKNITDEVLKNINVQYPISESLEYVNGGLASYDIYEGYRITENGAVNNNVFEYNIDTLNAGEEKVICVTAKVKHSNQYEEKVNSIAKIVLDNEIYETNIKTIEIERAAFDISASVDTNGKKVLEKDDAVVYTIKVKNIGKASSGINVTDNIPEQLEVSKIEYSVNGGEPYTISTSSQNIELTNSLNEGDELIINITAKVREIESSKDTNIQAANKATLTLGELTVDSNEVTINIKPEPEKVQEGEGDPTEGDLGSEDNKDNEGNQGNAGDEDNKDNNGDNTQPDKDNSNTQTNKYSISGVAWIDANKNGQKEETEKLQHSVIVSLVNKETGNFALDENGNRIKTVTDENGNYTFSNISAGTYIILFEFDTNTYTVTTYQKEGISKELNSDAILSTVTIDGQKKLAALTDNIQLTSNIENIDIGLMENATFDLSLDKQITKITVINSQGTETYEYEDGYTAKVDLVAKYMAGSDVIVDYKFTVTNNGDLVGYVDSLVDNLPSGLEFSSELNTDWYKGNDGKLYTTALSGKGIKPGESVEIALTLTKSMTEENAGTFVNSAELEKTSNLENISEKENTLENNEFSAILIISIKTGSAIMYIGITTLCLAIIGIGVYFIKKKVLNKVI